MYRNTCTKERWKMKISKEEIQKLADAINLEINDQEIAHIEESITDLTTRLDQLLNEEVKTDQRMMVATENINQFDSTHENEAEEKDHFKNLNNFDGEYIGVKKVIGDE